MRRQRFLYEKNRSKEGSWPSAPFQNSRTFWPPPFGCSPLIWQGRKSWSTSQYLGPGRPKNVPECPAKRSQAWKARSPGSAPGPRFGFYSVCHLRAYFAPEWSGRPTGTAICPRTEWTPDRDRDVWNGVDARPGPRRVALYARTKKRCKRSLVVCDHVSRSISLVPGALVGWSSFSCSGRHKARWEQNRHSVDR